MRSRLWLGLLHLCAVYLTTDATFTVELVAPRYVLRGHSALLRCDYSVSSDQIHKVEWFRAGRKLFQFVRGRSPPFREYHVHGASIDRNHSDERQLLLKDFHFEASGSYSCEVSTQTPIFTKRSDDREITVIQTQERAPVVFTSKALYHPGDTLLANCSSSPAHPAPHLSWLVNGQLEHGGRHQAHQHRLSGARDHLARATSKLSLPLTDNHSGLLTITCRASVPALLTGATLDVVDLQEYTLQVEVEPLPTAGCPAVRVSHVVMLLCFYMIGRTQR